MGKYLIEWYTKPDGSTQFRTRPPCELLTDEVLTQIHRRSKEVAGEGRPESLVKHIMVASLLAWLDGYECGKGVQ
jgi:hypothetical protein